MLSTGQLVTEEFYALGKLVRLGLGLTHFDGNTTLCMASAVSGYKMAFGSRRPARRAYEDLDQADCLLLIGANIADNHPLLAPRVLDNQACHHHRGRPPGHQDGDDRRPPPRRCGRGRDITLLNGIIRC